MFTQLRWLKGNKSNTGKNLCLSRITIPLSWTADPQLVWQPQMTGLLAVKLRSVKSLPRFVYIYIHTEWDTLYNSFSSLNSFYCLLSSIFIILGNKALHFLRTWYMYIVPGLKFVNPSGWYPWISFALLKTKMNSGYPPDGFIIFGPWYCYNPQNIISSFHQPLLSGVAVWGGCLARTSRTCTGSWASEPRSSPHQSSRTRSRQPGTNG